MRARQVSAQITEVEGIKARSNFLRGSIANSLLDPATRGLAEQDTHLVKFHGFYQQDDRDLRAERLAQKLEPALSFMIRVRVPGGRVTPEQWLAMDQLATRYANRALRLTTRQAFQLHGVIKHDLKSTIGEINACLLDTIAACGDVNRNVMCCAVPELSPTHGLAYETACEISARLTPHTGAYHELWLNGKKQVRSEETDNEPIYGPTYLPRKFKIAVAIPPVNDVDVFAQDLGLIAIEEGGRLAGYNVIVGGGMGMSHGEPTTYPRLADAIGFCKAKDASNIAQEVVKLQRDFGDRTNRKHARLKYTIDDRGLNWFKQELFDRLGFELPAARRYEFLRRGDDIGWREDHQGKWHLTLFIPEGRVQDTADCQLATCLSNIAELHGGDFRLTPNQNLIVARIEPSDRHLIEAEFKQFGIDPLQSASPLRHQALACVALPNCPLAFAEAERYLPDFTDKLDALLSEQGLSNEPISVRLSGCPNGCSRPYLAEIALVGKAPGSYNLLLGGSALGDRMNRVALENADEESIIRHLRPLLKRFTKERTAGESFGDFTLRILTERDA